MYSRPKPSETEEDLLRLQEEYEKNKAANKITPAAKFVSLQSKSKYFIFENIVENLITYLYR